MVSATRLPEKIFVGVLRGRKHFIYALVRPLRRQRAGVRMSEQKRTHGDIRPNRQRMVVILADPQAPRRRHLLRGHQSHQVLQAASLNEIYPMAEEMVPDILAMAADFLAEPEMEGVIRLAELLGTAVLFYAEQGTIPLRIPLPDRAPLVPLRPQDRIDDLLAGRAGGGAGTTIMEGQADLPELVLVGASTGGIAAIETVLTAFPADCPPTLVVQHIRDGFIPGLVQRLNLRCRPRIVEASHGLALQRGTVYFAADAERHLTVSGPVTPRCALVATAPVHGHRPAVDPLFESALARGRRVSAALLTGMGTDGALGLAALRRAGAHTIAQDRRTSIVWGMPGAAVAADAAVAVLPIDRIGQALLAGHGQTHAGYRGQP